MVYNIFFQIAQKPEVIILKQMSIEIIFRKNFLMRIVACMSGRFTITTANELANLK